MRHPSMRRSEVRPYHRENNVRRGSAKTTQMSQKNSTRKMRLIFGLIA
jgi:hypothetical protein